MIKSWVIYIFFILEIKLYHFRFTINVSLMLAQAGPNRVPFLTIYHVFYIVI